MEMTVQTIATNIMDFSSQHIAVTLWAVAKLDFNPGKDILEVISRRVLTLVHDYNPQNIANTLWSFATLGEYPNPELLDLCAQRAVELMPVISSTPTSRTPPPPHSSPRTAGRPWALGCLTQISSASVLSKVHL
jgi:hypothetical protein